MMAWFCGVLCAANSVMLKDSLVYLCSWRVVSGSDTRFGLVSFVSRRADTACLNSLLVVLELLKETYWQFPRLSSLS
ncbi:hypothetical protein EJ05DRAFT_56829 [Pseudovirgaria hyperparasitica]|uniref:Secreted protein n=1 Tax=Pseudovirgaria hyperparasitica TaxID=470096 RepID=A0A6A6W2R4_9PEZI|nr:uncharacterized protein EJ05DRAFT_56829 [Pseudovirgaria hyperparasitica]KAF2757142.1 hypothetical protein EJ05DRAFT_56829 [Pseudovirgaria hyperparasitica]